MRAAILLLLAGCFGEGPTPGTPSRATVLLALELHPIKADGDCRSGRYIGNVAIGGDFAYALTHTFLPACGGDSTGNANESITSTVYQFSKTTGSPMKIGEAGKTQEGGGPRPHVGASATDAVWLYSETGSSTVQVASKSGAIGGGVMVSGGAVPASVIVDATKTYFATWNGPDGPAFMSPRYPCCGTSGNPPPSSNGFFQLTHAVPTVISAMPVQPKFTPDQIKDTLVANSSTFFYFEAAMTNVNIKALPKTGGTAQDVAILGNDVFPGGLAADDTHIAYASTIDMKDFQNTVQHSCSINVADATAPFTSTTLINTNKFSCTDVALDATHVYFPIVELFDADSGNLLRNRGIGRFDLATKEFESIELGIPGPEAGPREIYVDGDGLILVAPYAVARIAKTELAGKHEIEK